MATNAGGTTAPWAGWTYTGAAFDPATLAASMWSRDYVAPTPWVSLASAGISGSCPPWNSFNSGVDPVASAIGTSGYDAADFDGSTCYTDCQVTEATLFTPTAGGILCLFNADVAAADTGNKNDNPTIFGGNAGTSPRLTFSSSGVAGVVYSGGYIERMVACATSGWHLVMMRWDGVNLGMTLDSAAEVTVASGTVYLTGALELAGINGVWSAFYDGKIAEIMTFRTTPTPTEYANFKAYCNTRYGLSL